MISSESLRGIIEDELNSVAQKLGAPFKFRIFSNVGDFEAAIEDPTRQSLPTPLINGIIIDYASEIAPLAGITSYSMSQGLTLYVPRTPNPIAGSGIDRALAVIQSFVQNAAGQWLRRKGDTHDARFFRSRRQKKRGSAAVGDPASDVVPCARTGKSRR